MHFVTGAKRDFKRKVRRSMKKVSPMEDKKIYLLAELIILLGFLEEVKTIFKEVVS